MSIPVKASVDLPAKKRRMGFTLIEILVVLTIIGILMALVIGIAGPAQQQARVFRAKGEVAGIETALGRFEVDNGFAPNAITIATNSGIYGGDPETYKASARAIFLAVTGRQYYQSTATSGPNYFTTLKEGQVGFFSASDKQNSANIASGDYGSYSNAIAQGDWLKDPWGNAYGYFYDGSNATNHSLFNQVSYDLWSTSGEYTNAPATSPTVKRWTANWANQ